MAFARDIAEVDEDVARFLSTYDQEYFRAKTGLPLSTYFSALKLRWLLENVPGARRRASSTRAGRSSSSMGNFAVSP